MYVLLTHLQQDCVIAIINLSSLERGIVRKHGICAISVDASPPGSTLGVDVDLL